MVYRGNPQSSFYGAYFFGDMGTGQLWAATQKGGVLSEQKDCGTFPVEYSHFTADHDGRIFTSNYRDGSIWMLEHAELVPAAPMPLRLRSSVRGSLQAGTGPSAGAEPRYGIDGRRLCRSKIPVLMTFRSAPPQHDAAESPG